MNVALQPPDTLRPSGRLREPNGGGARALWALALRQRSVWLRAAKVGLPVGCLQSIINQGDVWWSGQATGLTLTKTIISPLVTFSVALIAAAGTWIEKKRSMSSRAGN